MFSLAVVVLYHLFFSTKEALPKLIAKDFRHKVCRVGHLMFWVGTIDSLVFQVLSLFHAFGEDHTLHILLLFLDVAILLLEQALKAEHVALSEETVHS